jgi:putative flavoprotein involved in K+ transport
MLDCLVIGAGHSGLISAHFLKQAGLSYRVVDGISRIGEVWRRRPAGLRMFTSRQFCGLADVRMEGDPWSFPLGSEFADFLERFAREKQLEVSLERRVVRLRHSQGTFTAELSNGEVIASRTVINATGANQQPVIPEFAARLDPAVKQAIAATFRCAADIDPTGMVLVVGDGASGRQIAQELAPTHRVALARGRVRNLVPNRILGLDVCWWLIKIGAMFAHRDSIPARIVRRRDPIPCASASDKALASSGVVLKPRAMDAAGHRIIFADGSSVDIATIIWCGGYRENVSWIDIPAITEVDTPIREGGKTTQEGLYVVGRKWLTCRASELVMGAQRDAELVVGHVKRQVALPPS